MHEMSIASNIFEIVNEELSGRDFDKLVGVTVDIGELVAVVPDSLQFCYQAITGGTRLKDSTLDINIVPPLLSCLQCQKKFQGDLLNLTCPHCGGIKCKEISGRELLITKIIVE